MKLDSHEQGLKTEIQIFDEFCSKNENLDICTCAGKPNVFGKYADMFFNVETSIVEMSESCPKQLIKKVLTKTYSQLYESNDDFFEKVQDRGR